MTVAENGLGKKTTEKSKGWWLEDIQKLICNRK